MIEKSHIQELEKLGQRIRKLRIERGLSQSELSDTANIGKHILGMIERAEKNITLVNIEKIANALKVKIDDLLKPSNNGEKTD